MVPWAHQSPQPKWHLDRLSRFVVGHAQACPCPTVTDRQTGLIGWLEFNVPCQHKYGYIREERSGVESYPLT